MCLIIALFGTTLHSTPNQQLVSTIFLLNTILEHVILFIGIKISITIQAGLYSTCRSVNEYE